MRGKKTEITEEERGKEQKKEEKEEEVGAGAKGKDLGVGEG